MIVEADRLLAALLAPSLPKRTAISFERPDASFASAVSAPTLSCFLHRIVEDTGRRLADLMDVRGADGRVEGRQAPVRHYELHYLVSAWTPSAAEEHDLLDAVLVAALDGEILPGSDPDDPTWLRVALPGPDPPLPHDLWSSLGVPVRASLALMLVVALRPPLDTELALPAEEITLGMATIDAQPSPTTLSSVPANRRWTTIRIKEKP